MNSFADKVTPVVLTGNEEPNIGRTLGQLQWARRVLVCDSVSTDRTVEIAQSFPNVEVYQRQLDDLATQWSFALAKVESEWALTLDADYFVPDSFTRELSALSPSADVGGYEAAFLYAVNGHPLRGSLYPPRAVLLRSGSYDLFMDGHTQRVRVHGSMGMFRERLIHDDRKSLRRFIARQKRYMRQEASKLLTADRRTLSAASRLRLLRVLAPVIVVPYTLFVKGLILDGLAGLHYAFERFIAEAILSLELFRQSRSR